MTANSKATAKGPVWQFARVHDSCLSLRGCFGGPVVRRLRISINGRSIFDEGDGFAFQCTTNEPVVPISRVTYGVILAGSFDCRLRDAEQPARLVAVSESMMCHCRN